MPTTAAAIILAATHQTLNARQFYDDASAVIPILLLAVIYQASTLRARPRTKLGWDLSMAVLVLAIAALGEFECLHVASGYDPTRQGQVIVLLALVLLGGFAIAEPLYGYVVAINERPASHPARSVRKDKGYRAFLVSLLALAAIVIGGGLALSALGNPPAAPKQPTAPRTSITGRR